MADAVGTYAWDTSSLAEPAPRPTAAPGGKPLQTGTPHAGPHAARAEA